MWLASFSFTVKNVGIVCEVLLLYIISGVGGGARRSVVVKALRYKPAGRGFNSQWCRLEFFSDIILLDAVWPWGQLNI